MLNTAKLKAARKRQPNVAADRSRPVATSEDTGTMKTISHLAGNSNNDLDAAPSQFPSRRTRHSKLGKNTVVMCIWVLVLTMANLFGLATEETVEVLLPDTGWARIVAHWLSAMALVVPIMVLLNYLASLEETELQNRVQERVDAAIGTQAQYGMSAEKIILLREQLTQQFMEEEFRAVMADSRMLKDPMVGLFRSTMAAKHAEFLRHHQHLDPDLVQFAARDAQKQRHATIHAATPSTGSSRGLASRY